MDIKEFFNQYRNYVLILLGILALFVFLLVKDVPQIMNTYKTINDYKSSQTTLVDKQRELKELEAKLEESNKDDKKELKPFFKPIDGGIDTESIIANEFSEILTLMRANSIKARAINYTYDPEDDNFVKGAKDSFNVAKLDMDMVSNYKNFESFLKELYKHEHFLDISSVEVVPYQKNKRFLLIKFQLKLYAKK